MRSILVWFLLALVPLVSIANGGTVSEELQTSTVISALPLTSTSTPSASTTAPLPTYPPIPNPYMLIELQSLLTASYSMTLSCGTDYNRQFTQSLKSQLQRAKQEMLATPTFCPGTTSADLTSAGVNLVAIGTQVHLSYGVEIVSFGANTLEAMSTCSWQLGAYLANFNNWRLPIFTDIFNCPRLTFVEENFEQTNVQWVC